MASKKDQAYQALQSYQAQAPGPYQSPYKAQIDSLMQNLGNRNFSYNYREDPTYQQYKRQYETTARRASENAQANAAAGSWRLADASLYVTLEPCPMCAGAILNARIGRVYFGARDSVMGAVGGVMNLFMEDFPNRPAVVGGVLEEECAAVLKEFFGAVRRERECP